MTVIDETQALLTERLSAVNDEQRKLERALAALSDSTNGSGRKPRRKASTRRGGGRKQAPRGKRQAEVFDFIVKHPDTTATIIADSLKTSTGNIHQVLGKLRKEGKVGKGTPVRATSR